MNAPEKIYIDANENWHRTYTAFSIKAKGDDIEYIRTDAFIKKVSEWLGKNLSKYSELTNEDEYGNKLNEVVMNIFYGQAVNDFIQYMKGE